MNMSVYRNSNLFKINFNLNGEKYRALSSS
jgi:hypothetical protein